MRLNELMNGWCVFRNKHSIVVLDVLDLVCCSLCLGRNFLHQVYHSTSSAVIEASLSTFESTVGPVFCRGAFSDAGAFGYFFVFVSHAPPCCIAGPLTNMKSAKRHLTSGEGIARKYQPCLCSMKIHAE